VTKKLEKERLFFHAKNRTVWRKWLEKNHSIKENVWLVMYRKESDTPSVNYAEAVEEALCFGWIDSVKNKIDDESSCQYFSKRKPKSAWSKSNKQRVDLLSKLKLIEPAGQAVIDSAKKSGTWNALDEVENLTVPNDLKKAFSKNKTALKYFEVFPPSSRKIILGWISSAKQTETREKRIKETVILAAKNIRANHYVKKDI
jgi:uncharacterized protein YdeI (YjbR/CyaY-like superfamily)